MYNTSNGCIQVKREQILTIEEKNIFLCSMHIAEWT